MTTLATSFSRVWLNAPSWTYAGSASDAKLHTATSSAEVYCTTSVQRFEQRMVPKFCWLLFWLHASLYSMYGVPVSI